MTSHALQRVVVAVAVAGGAAAAVVLLPRWRARRKIRRMPKIELHAHLNGSIRRATLAELAAAKFAPGAATTWPPASTDLGGDGSLRPGFWSRASPRPVHGRSRSQPRRRRDASTDDPHLAAA